MKQLEKRGMTIVLKGNFNPKIYHPSWFASHDITISDDEAEKAELDICHADVTSFELDWMTVNITRDQFVIASEQESDFEQLRDFVLGTFQVLRHTPLRVMGINHIYLFSMDTEEEWHDLGDKLAPKKIWNDIFDGHTGMRQLVIENSRGDDDNFNGHIRVHVEPGDILPKEVRFKINDHYELREEETEEPNPEGSGIVEQILKDNWRFSSELAEKIVKGIH